MGLIITTPLSTADPIFVKNSSLEDLLEIRILYVTREFSQRWIIFHIWYFLNIGCSDVITDLRTRGGYGIIHSQEIQTKDIYRFQALCAFHMRTKNLKIAHERYILVAIIMRSVTWLIPKHGWYEGFEYLLIGKQMVDGLQKFFYVGTRVAR
jgi:hypothetical protein